MKEELIGQIKIFGKIMYGKDRPLRI